MDLQTAIKQTGKDFLSESMANTKAMFEQQKLEAKQAEQQPEVPPVPVDLYDERAKAKMEPRRVRGTSPHLMLDLQDLLDNGIEDAYKQTLDESELLRAEGQDRLASLNDNQYMDKWFRPVVDALIRLNSKEEVLASQEALEILDTLAVLPGSGRADGYTAQYVTSLYDTVEGQTFSSDAYVRDQLRRIDMLCDNNQMRSAISTAQRLQQQIDAGEHRATPDDYDTVRKIALRGA